MPAQIALLVTLNVGFIDQQLIRLVVQL